METIQCKYKITDTQRQLMDHTISGPDRNWFATSPDSDDARQFERLVKVGYAVSEQGPSFAGNEVVFRLTKTGKQALQQALHRYWGTFKPDK